MDDVEQALSVLRAVLAAIQRGELEASSTAVAGLWGGVSALESVRDTDV